MGKKIRKLSFGHVKLAMLSTELEILSRQVEIGSWRSKVRNIMGTMVMKKVFKVQKLNEITQE